MVDCSMILIVPPTHLLLIHSTVTILSPDLFKHKLTSFDTDIDTRMFYATMFCCKHMHFGGCRWIDLLFVFILYIFQKMNVESWMNEWMNEWDRSKGWTRLLYTVWAALLSEIWQPNKCIELLWLLRSWPNDYTWDHMPSVLAMAESLTLTLLFSSS